uniref:Uncharacterized protein n=1 Tax=Rhizophora mucronata TaxID=61149 RepID=A0A2P2PY13_RHIMU
MIVIVLSRYVVSKLSSLLLLIARIGPAYHVCFRFKCADFCVREKQS